MSIRPLATLCLLVDEAAGVAFSGLNPTFQESPDPAPSPLWWHRAAVNCEYALLPLGVLGTDTKVMTVSVAYLRDEAFVLKAPHSGLCDGAVITG